MSPPQELINRVPSAFSNVRYPNENLSSKITITLPSAPHPRSCCCTWLAWHPRRAQQLLRSFRFRRGQTERNCYPRPWPTCCYPLSTWATVVKRIGPRPFVFAIRVRSRRGATVPRATALPRRSPRSEGVWLGRDVKIDFCRHHGAYISHQHAERGCYG
jgi:hypothetical protein